MRMADPKPTFSYLVTEIARRWPSLAYIHVVEPRVSGVDDREVEEGEVRLAHFSVSVFWLSTLQSNDFLREIWKPRPFISAGGYTREVALEVAETKNDLIAVGRLFISNVSEQPTRE